MNKLLKTTKMKRYLLAVLIFAGCAVVAPAPGTNGWTQTYGKNVTLKFYGETGFSFDFGEPHYVLKESGPLKIGQTITVTYQIETTFSHSAFSVSTQMATRQGMAATAEEGTAPKPVQVIADANVRLSSSGNVKSGVTAGETATFKTVEANTGSPAFRLMIQRGNDMTSQFGRYWSSDYVILSGGVSTLSRASAIERDNALRKRSLTPAQNLLSAVQLLETNASWESQSFGGTQTLTRKRGGDALCPSLLIKQFPMVGLAAMKVQSSIAATKTFSVKIDPSTWTDVYGGKGSEHLDEFKKTLAECGHVGITFGGTTGGFGHGCLSTGKATFTLIDFVIK